jgi:hypothetical protein
MKFSSTQVEGNFCLNTMARIFVVYIYIFFFSKQTIGKKGRENYNITNLKELDNLTISPNTAITMQVSIK